MIEYSGYLSYAQLTAEQLAAATEALGNRSDLFDVQPTWLEVEYAGRDHGRQLVAALRTLAAVIGDAKGEVVCEIDVEETTPLFEFYSIQGGKLLRQRGHVVREAFEEVEPAASDRVHQVA